MRSKILYLKAVHLVVSIFMLTMLVQAQTDTGSPSSFAKLRYGIRGGGSISALSSDGKLGTDWLVGYQAGATLSYSVLDWLHISFEPVYAKFNSKINPANLYYPNQDILDRIAKSEVALDCADLPLVFKLYIPGYSGKIKPVVSIGATSGIYFNAVSTNTWKYNVGSQPVVADVTDTVTERFRYWDIAGLGGAGFEMGNISIELYYRFKLRDLNTVHSSVYKDFGLNSMQLNLGIRF
jgi:hypothetical protein